VLSAGSVLLVATRAGDLEVRSSRSSEGLTRDPDEHLSEYSIECDQEANIESNLLGGALQSGVLQELSYTLSLSIRPNI
jgi:hypothetical protein